MKKPCLNPDMQEDGKEMFFSFQVEESGAFMVLDTRERGSQLIVLKGVLQVKMLMEAKRKDLLLQGKYVGKTDVKDLLTHQEYTLRAVELFFVMVISRILSVVLWKDSGEVVHWGEIAEVLCSDSCKNIPALASMPVICRNVHFRSSVFIYALRILDFHFGTTYREGGSRGHFNHYTLEIL